MPAPFEGSSAGLPQTVVVPTLDSPIAEGKSAIWCASFQLAWNRLKEDLAKGPIQIANAQPIADRLNAADLPADVLERNDVYAAAGLTRDGIADRIRAEMARRFPTVNPGLDAAPSGAIAYAYLAASSKYEYTFFENDRPLLFTDSSGKATRVGSFGIREKDHDAYYRLREQVQILSRPDDEELAIPRSSADFILDPCKSSRPYQIVLARVGRKPTLAETLADVERKIAAAAGPAIDRRQLNSVDTLLIPNMEWRVSHHFKELEGKDRRLLNPALLGLNVDTALQTIHFRLDRSGAELAAQSKQYMTPTTSYFHFDRPFLVYMKRRGGKHPFLVVWVENADLLQAR